METRIKIQFNAVYLPFTPENAPENPFLFFCAPSGVLISSITMPDMAFRFRRRLKYVHRRFREWRMLWKGIASTSHPVLAHIIPMRRCNLACAYCNEYDDFSKPVP